MSVFNVTTGFGYLEDELGNIVTKYELPVGKHVVRAGYMAIEVSSKEELNKVSIYVAPHMLQAMVDKQIIKDEIKQMAIDRLKARGKFI